LFWCRRNSKWKKGLWKKLFEV